MEQYISKSALVAEIERRRDYYKRNPLLVNAKYCIDEDNAILKLLDTLEVEEVDFEKEFDNYANGILACDVQFEPFTHLHKCAKYFFELGMAARNKAQKGE